MAWRYVRFRDYVLDEQGNLVAEVSDPADGPLIALAPRMEAWMREFQGRKLGPEDFARLHDEAQAIFRELDEARGKVGP